MPINRAAFNALVDDTGTGNGTVWEKTTIKDVVLDPVDAAIVADAPPASSGMWTSYVPTVTQNAGTVTLITTHVCAYTVIGKRFSINFQLTIKVENDPSQIVIGMPVGYLPAPHNVSGGMFVNPNGFGGQILTVGNGFMYLITTSGAGGAHLLGTYQILGSSTFDIV